MGSRMSGGNDMQQLNSFLGASPPLRSCLFLFFLRGVLVTVAAQWRVHIPSLSLSLSLSSSFFTAMPPSHEGDRGTALSRQGPKLKERVQGTSFGRAMEAGLLLPPGFNAQPVLGCLFLHPSWLHSGGKTLVVTL